MLFHHLNLLVWARVFWMMTALATRGGQVGSHSEPIGEQSLSQGS